MTVERYKKFITNEKRKSQVSALTSRGEVLTESKAEETLESFIAELAKEGFGPDEIVEFFKENFDGIDDVVENIKMIAESTK